jgi:signal transduction histidine kinase
VRALIVASWIAALLPFGAARICTIVVAGAVALVGVGVPALSLAAIALAATWTLAAAAALPSHVELALVDVATAAAAAVPLIAVSRLWSREAGRALVVELGSGRPGLPLTRRLAKALADPELQLRYLLPDDGWVDERGAPAAAPDEDGPVTRVAAPAGGEVALVHGARAAPDARLARAAASAAALSLESTRLDAEVRARARDVAESRRRLLTAADDERRALEQRLSEDVLTRLRHVDRLLAGNGLAEERRELESAVQELVALGRGLYPPSLARSDPEEAFRELARRSPVPTTIELVGAFDALPEAQRAAAWFVCSEALTNVARHAEASAARVRIVVDERALEVQVEDDGRGGATLERGLRGLADRIEALGGRLKLVSPAGGPTVLRATLPLLVSDTKSV